MRYDQISIENFKGIKEIELPLSNPGESGKVFTLVGLNESGKTTILEAINFFNRAGESLEGLYERGYKVDDVHDLVPVSERDNFNATISVTASICLEDGDDEKIAKYCNRQFGFKVEEIPDRFSVSRRHTFKNSKLVTGYDLWDFGITGKRRRAKKVDLFNWTGDDGAALKNYISSRLPSILYFPSFAFEIPGKIYLEDREDLSAANKYYRLIVQDILDSLDNQLSIDEHLVERVRSNWGFEKRNLQSVLQKMGLKITSDVVNAWEHIFGKDLGTKRIVLEYGNDDGENEKGVYIQFFIEDGISQFLVSERSLGFRWFFCFLLFTQFRGDRKGFEKALFLFDEPASNLHSTAQTQLLKSFSNITEKGCNIVYSTHSQYLINPHWLESTFIVTNEAITYEDEDIYSFDERTTDIRVTPYRRFVSEHPDETTYFQPILDVLDFKPSNLELVPRALIVEGKNDYYTLNLMKKFLSVEDDGFAIFPGFGATAMDALISLHAGWGRDFILLLDADKTGRQQKEKYIENYPVAAKQLLTLEDIKPSWRGKELEDLLTDGERNRIIEAVFGKQKYTKKLFNRAVQEMLSVSFDVKFTKSSSKTFSDLFEFILDRMDVTNRLDSEA